MAKDYQKKIATFLKKVRLDDKTLGSSRIPVQGAIEHAILARREGDKSGCSKWTKHALGEVNDLRVYSDGQFKTFAKLLDSFIKEQGYFSYTKALKLRAAEIKKLPLMFRKKGAAAAHGSAKQLHTQMIKAGELPRTASFDDFEKAVAQQFQEAARYSTKTTNVLSGIKFAPIISQFKLGKGAEKDLKALVADMLKQGVHHSKSIKSAQAILLDAGNTKAKGVDLANALHDQIFDVMA